MKKGYAQFVRYEKGGVSLLLLAWEETESVASLSKKLDRYLTISHGLTGKQDCIFYSVGVAIQILDRRYH